MTTNTLNQQKTDSKTIGMVVDNAQSDISKLDAFKIHRHCIDLVLDPIQSYLSDFLI